MIIGKELRWVPSYFIMVTVQSQSRKNYGLALNSYKMCKKIVKKTNEKKEGADIKG